MSKFQNSGIDWLIFCGSVFTIVLLCIPLAVNPESGKQFLEGAFDYTVRQFSVTGFDVASFIGIGGLCAAAFLWSRTRSEPIPIHDPRILDAIHHHE